MSPDRPATSEKKYKIHPYYMRMIEWMVFEYDEKDTGNLKERMSKDLKIPVDHIKGAISELNKVTKCDNIISCMTRLVNYSVKMGQFPIEKIGRPGEELSDNENALLYQLQTSRMPSEIMRELNIDWIEHYKEIQRSLFKKIGAKNRYFAAAYAQKVLLEQGNV